MKQLYIMRHASAASGGPDKERPLNFDGRKQIDGLLTRSLGLFDQVTHILCSSAVRTKLTYAGLKEILPLHADIAFLDGLYNATAYDILSAIHNLPDSAGDVLIIAHNPGVSQFANLAKPNLTLSMGTSQIAIYDIDITYWPALDFSNCTLRDVV